MRARRERDLRIEGMLLAVTVTRRRRCAIGRWQVALVLWTLPPLGLGCSDGERGGADGAGDGDVDTDADADLDADTDVDADAAADGEPAADSDAPGDGGFDTGADAVPTDAGLTGPCDVEVAAGETRQACGGIDYVLSVPDDCVAGGCGLVVDVHGASMNAEMQNNNTNMRELGRENGYVVVQPSAPGTPPFAVWLLGHDRPVFDILASVADALDVDEDRIHFTGFSQGGFMTWRFVCAHADVLASAAPAAAGLECGGGVSTRSCSFAGDEMPSRTVPILFLAGIRDAYVGIECTRRQRDAVAASLGMSFDSMVSEDDDYTWSRYVDESGVAFEHLEHDYVSSASSVVPLVPDIRGHCFPGSEDPGTTFGQVMPFGCDPPNAFRWGEVAMAFFVAHPRER